MTKAYNDKEVSVANYVMVNDPYSPYYNRLARPLYKRGSEWVLIFDDDPKSGTADREEYLCSYLALDIIS